MPETAVQETEVKTHDDVINEEIEQEHAEAEARKAKVEEESNTGDKAVDDFLNGETDELPEGTSEISEKEAEELQKETETSAS